MRGIFLEMEATGVEIKALWGCFSFKALELEFGIYLLWGPQAGSLNAQASGMGISPSDWHQCIYCPAEAKPNLFI